MGNSVDKKASLKFSGQLRAAIVRIGIPAIFSVILFITLLFYIVIPITEENLLEYKKEMVKEQTHSIFGVIEEHYNLANEGKWSHDEAKKITLELIRNIRYGENHQDYFWINDREPIMLMHPYTPELEGQNIDNYTDPDGTRLFHNMVKITDEQGEGYSEYMWQFHNDSANIVQKISYVKLFEPWGWIIGTGIYIEDVKEDIASITNRITIISLGILAIISLISAYTILQWYQTETERSKTEEKLRKANLKLNKIFRIKTEFINRVAHDLKSPITPIKMLIPTFNTKRMVKNDMIKLNIIDRNLKNLNMLINDVLNIARIDSIKQKKLRLTTRNLSKLTVSLIEEQMPVFKKKHFEIVTKIEKTPDIRIEEDKIREVISNIISNAIKYSSSKTKLIFTVREAGKNILFELQDNGPGIEQKNITKIFKQFYVIEVTKKTDSTGLGLSICKAIIKTHKGKVWAESKGLGKGTKISFTIPINHKTKQNSKVDGKKAKLSFTMPTSNKAKRKVRSK